MLATSQVPLYVVAAPRAPAVEAPDEAASAPATGKRRGGRKRAAAMAGAPRLEPAVPVEAAAPGEVQSGEVEPAETRAVEPQSAEAQMTRAKTVEVETVEAQTVEAQTVEIQPVEVPSIETPDETPADAAAMAVSAPVADMQRSKRKRGAGRAAPPASEAPPASVEVAAPIDEQPVESSVEHPIDEPPIEPAADAVGTKIGGPAQPAAEDAVAAVGPPSPADPVAVDPPVVGTAGPARKSAIRAANRQKRSNRA
jgi:hypothetical protein